MLDKIDYSSADGAKGYITDVTKEEFYQDPPIELYDELEYDCYKLICNFAHLIGVGLDENAVDYRLANHIRDTVIDTLEDLFDIPFPIFGENEQEHNERINTAKSAFNALKKENDKQKIVNLVGDGFEAGLQLYANEIESFKKDLADQVDNIDDAWGYYNELIDLGPVGFYEEYQYQYAFSDDFILEYGCLVDPDDINVYNSEFDDLDSLITTAAEQYDSTNSNPVANKIINLDR